MNKNTKSILLLIMVSLIIAAALNFLLGAFLDLSSDKPDAHVNSSSVLENTTASNVIPFTAQEAAQVSSPQSAEALQATSTPTPISALTPTSTPRHVSAEDYQDAQWIANVQKHSALLSNDIEEIGNTTSDLDSDKLATYGQYLIDDTQMAIEENKQYIVSPKCQDARKEWELALNDYSSAGELMTQAAGETNNNNTDGDDIKQALSLIDSGSGHFRKVQEFLKTAA